MILTLSSDGSGIVKLPPFSCLIDVKVQGISTTAYTELEGVGIQLSPAPPNGLTISVEYEDTNIKQTAGVENTHLKVTNPVYTKRYDVVDTTTSYLGDAQVGSSIDSPRWRIQKLTFGVDGDVSVTFANGSTEFNQVWADRASLSYS